MLNNWVLKKCLILGYLSRRIHVQSATCTVLNGDKSPMKIRLLINTTFYREFSIWNWYCGWHFSKLYYPCRNIIIKLFFWKAFWWKFYYTLVKRWKSTLKGFNFYAQNPLIIKCQPQYQFHIMNVYDTLCSFISFHQNYSFWQLTHIEMLN
jgi:hypothetical protein